MQKNKTGLSFLWISFVSLITDLATKAIVVKNFQLYESVNLLPFFNLTYAQNTGSAFSFMADQGGWQKYFFIVLALVISGMLIHFLKQNRAEQKLQNWAYALIIGGALGNMIDRAYNGFVVDFLDFFWQDWHYPIFNVADIAICVGAGLLALDAFKNDPKKAKK